MAMETSSTDLVFDDHELVQGTECGRGEFLTGLFRPLFDAFHTHVVWTLQRTSDGWEQFSSGLYVYREEDAADMYHAAGGR